MARGGARQGTPGKGYSNRTDLATNRKPATGATSPASGGVNTGAASAGQQVPAWTSPDQVPRLNDPSGRPNEPVTSGLLSGPGRGPEAIGVTPPDPAVQSLQAAYAAMPTPELRRVLSRFRAKGIV